MDYSLLNSKPTYYRPNENVHVSYFFTDNYDKEIVNCSYRTSKMNCYPNFMTLVTTKDVIL